jgi:predicted kinase
VLDGRYFNPDDYLETETGRVFTPERSAAAFECAYTELERAARSAPPGARLFVVVGVQGAGKSTWIRENAAQLGEAALFFDAALPRAVHRSRVIAIAKSAGLPAIAVWVQAPLEVALARNQLRRADQRVPEFAIRSVHSIMERPTQREGFEEVREALAPTTSTRNGFA